MPPKRHTILLGVVGSRAYGLATATSDTDRKGVFVTPTRDVLSLRSYRDTVESKNPDVCLYEVKHFFKLCLQCNPNVIELLWLEDYEELTEEGQRLLGNRHLFLSERAIRAAYGGYAKAQIEKATMEKRAGTARGDKHVRHCFRLLNQGIHLLQTGFLRVRVEDPEEYFELPAYTLEELREMFRDRLDILDKCQTSLPYSPDEEAVNDLLLDIRSENWS